MEPLPTFRLFPDPLREGVFERTEKACELCNRARGYLYTGPRQPFESELRFCPWCLADGSASKSGIHLHYFFLFNKCRVDEIELEELLTRTPGFWTIQENSWQACCNRPCIYLGAADASDLRGRWAEAVPSMFADTGLSKERQEEIVDRVERNGSPEAYVFQCQDCKKLKATWDFD